MNTVLQKSKKRIRLGDISVNFLVAMHEAAAKYKCDLTPIFRRYHVSTEMLDTPNARITIAKFMRIGHDAIQNTKIPHLGILAGEQMHLGRTGLAGLASMTAGPLFEAMNTFIQFEKLSSQNCRGHSRYFFDHEQLICQFYSISPYNNYNFFVVDSILSTWNTFAKSITGESQLLDHIEIEYPKNHYSSLMEKHFSCPVIFMAKRNALIFKSVTSDIPSIYSSPSMHRQLVALCEKELKKINGNQSLENRVAELIIPFLHGRPPEIEVISRQMGMASWTLRRKLKEKHTCFSKILDQTRRELAESYVTDTLLNFTEIAFLLGFSSPSSFQRAFKRWTTLNPGEFRMPN